MSLLALKDNTELSLFVVVSFNSANIFSSMLTLRRITKVVKLFLAMVSSLKKLVIQ